jgi:predicted RNA-binding protein with PUA-like domain
VIVLERKSITVVPMKQYWLVKSEPSSYAWSDLVRDKSTSWTGVRNFMARKNLRTMQKGDAVFFYHSVTDKEIVGTAEVSRTAYPDATAKEGDWVTVDLVPKRALKSPVTLEEIKKNSKLKNMTLLRCSRLSVQPVTKTEFDEIVRMSQGTAVS